MDDLSNVKVVVIGAGPVGALAALYAAQRGYQVDVYELRSDLRLDSTTPLHFTKSINLALSERGINALRNADSTSLLDAILADTIPLFGRMIHSRDMRGQLSESAQLYDRFGRFQRAADRAGLNKQLLHHLAAMPNVTLNFDHKLTGADFKRKLAWLEDRRESVTNLGLGSTTRYPEREIQFDFLIGADGAHSAVRYHLMKFVRMDYRQDYIDTLWCEFHIAPVHAKPMAASDPRNEAWHNTVDSDFNNTADHDLAFAVSPNHLHIWPAGEFMFIAIPSTDFSFTCTLFMPASYFSHLSTASSTDPTAVASFFNMHFPGVAGRLIPSHELNTQFQHNPHLPLISIKCSPYHFEGAAVFLGDAAHAMVPFYGQGMNAGLEDVRVLFECLDRERGSYEQAQAGTEPNLRNKPHAGNEDSSLKLGQGDRSLRSMSDVFARALSEYTRIRTPQAHAINDLAQGNYVEMRSGVRSPLYRLRKSVEEFLAAYAPWSGFATQYARVSFGNEGFDEVVKAVAWQQNVLRWLGIGLGTMFATGIYAGGSYWFGNSKRF